MKSCNHNFLEPSGPLQACNGTALPLPLHFMNIVTVITVTGLLQLPTMDSISDILRPVRIPFYCPWWAVCPSVRKKQVDYRRTVLHEKLPSHFGFNFHAQSDGYIAHVPICIYMRISNGIWLTQHPMRKIRASLMFRLHWGETVYVTRLLNLLISTNYESCSIVLKSCSLILLETSGPVSLVHIQVQKASMMDFRTFTEIRTKVK
jgi:hypothetical protein